MNYYEHHLGDYARDTGHLSALEHGIYRLLLDRIYATESGIPQGQQYRVAKASSRAEKAAVDTIIAEFFIVEAGRLWNKRARAEIDAYRAKSAKARRSANARWHPDVEDAEAMRTHIDNDANASTEHCEGNALQSPVPNPHSEDPPKPPAGGGLNGHTAVREKSPERQRKDSSRGAWVKAEIARKANDFEGLQQREPLIAEAIRLVGGFHAIGMTNTDRMGTMRARFRETFEQLLEREARE